MDISQRLKFSREAERLKNVRQRAHISEGRQESTAEHTWRLCLLAMVFEDQLPGLDFAKVLKMCVVHDLGEAIHGDVPAVMQKSSDDKYIFENCAARVYPCQGPDRCNPRSIQYISPACGIADRPQGMSQGFF